MIFRQIFDPRLAQYAYLLGCQRTREALIVDPERDIDRYLRLAATDGLRVTAVAETHIHADFLSGVREFLAHDPTITAYLSDEGDAEWKYQWPSAEDRVTLLKHGDRFQVGSIEIQVAHTPGHTPEHISFIVVDRGAGADEPLGVISGDFVFVGDLGRPDLLESAAGEAGAMDPSARRLHQSAQWFLEQPDHLQVWPGHGAGSACGKALGAIPQTTVGYERRFSPALEAAQRPQDDFVAFILDAQPEPPAYFARMKRLNKEGPPVLGRLPEPKEWRAPDLDAVTAETCILDTRPLEAWAAGHLKGALHTPLTKMFPTLAGSYVDPDAEVLLVVAAAQVEEVVRELVRIGIDRVVGFITPETLAGAEDLVATACVTFEQVSHQLDDGAAVLDVRSASEFASGHLPGAVNIAYTRLSPRLADVPRSDDLIVHCELGVRAAPAASYLESQGFEPTLVVDDFVPWFRARQAQSAAAVG